MQEKDEGMSDYNLSQVGLVLEQLNFQGQTYGKALKSPGCKSQGNQEFEDLIPENGMEGVLSQINQPEPLMILNDTLPLGSFFPKEEAGEHFPVLRDIVGNMPGSDLLGHMIDAESQEKAMSTRVLETADGLLSFPFLGADSSVFLVKENLTGASSRLDINEPLAPVPNQLPLDEGYFDLEQGDMAEMLGQEKNASQDAYFSPAQELEDDNTERLTTANPFTEPLKESKDGGLLLPIRETEKRQEETILPLKGEDIQKFSEKKLSFPQVDSADSLKEQTIQQEVTMTQEKVEQALSSQGAIGGKNIVSQGMVKEIQDRQNQLLEVRQITETPEEELSNVKENSAHVDLFQQEDISRERLLAEQKEILLTKTGRDVSKAPSHQLAEKITHHLKDGEQHITIQLYPKSLGKVDVRLIIADGQATAQFSVEKLATMEMLQRDERLISQLIADSGLELENGGLSFSLKQHADQQYGNEYPRLSQLEKDSIKDRYEKVGMDFSSPSFKDENIISREIINIRI